MKRTVAVLSPLLLCACSVPSLPSLPGLPGLGIGKTASATDSAPTTEAGPKSAARSPAKEGVCQQQSGAQRKAESMVAEIQTTFSRAGAAPELGAGLLVGARAGTAFVITARHVVQKDGAGPPSVQVKLQGGQLRPARLHSRFPAPAAPYADLAVIEVELGPETARQLQTFDWGMLRDTSDAFDVRDFVVIGNPAGRGLTTTPPGPAEAMPHEIRVNSGVMEPGYSGGGIFDQYRRLVGIATDDGGQFAVGYPIDAVLRLLAGAGVPVDLKRVPRPRPSVHLASVDARPDELAASMRLTLRSALRSAGYDADCASPTAYRLLVIARGWQESGTTTQLSIKPTLVYPNGGQTSLEDERLSLVHFIGQSPLQSEEKLVDRSKTASEAIVKRLDTAITRAEALAR